MEGVGGLWVGGLWVGGKEGGKEREGRGREQNRRCSRTGSPITRSVRGDAVLGL